MRELREDFRSGKGSWTRTGVSKGSRSLKGVSAVLGEGFGGACEALILRSGFGGEVVGLLINRESAWEGSAAVAERGWEWVLSWSELESEPSEWWPGTMIPSPKLRFGAAELRGGFDVAGGDVFLFCGLLDTVLRSTGDSKNPVLSWRALLVCLVGDRGFRAWLWFLETGD